MAKTGYTFVPALEHTYPGHPENSIRGVAIEKELQALNLFPDLTVYQPEMISMDAVYRVHHPQMIARVEGVALRGGGQIDGDTYMQAESFECARDAAGAVTQLATAIAQGEIENGFAAVRPPGHHAESLRPMGFCLINNIAVAARYLQDHFDYSKILIIDIDVHHGNGTQDIFYNDPSVYFMSIHQFGSFFYPGTGSLIEVGQDLGGGTTLNVPLPPGVGDIGYMRILNEVVAPKAAEFGPDFILVSAGYDAHWIDPLAAINLSTSGFAEISRRLVTLADTLCEGRILFVQEGGYQLDALAQGVVNSIYALQGRDLTADRLGDNSETEPNIDALIGQIRAHHLIE